MSGRREDGELTWKKGKPRRYMEANNGGKKKMGRKVYTQMIAA